MKRVAILISGGGSNMMALVRAMEGDFPARPALVLSNDETAGGLQKAAALGIATAVVDHRPYGKDRAAFEAAIQQQLQSAEIDIVCLAGFMRILTDGFTRQWEGRMLNIHPSLLPEFKGLHTHERAIAAGVPTHGCTVHLVTAALDDGPILGQARVDVAADDTPETLAQKVLVQEHRLYPAVLRRFAEGDMRPVFLA
ncbi:phosphoribosylglycinamide formyltransferase [Ketogulonicigenium robustum]|uniref:Phosphoribosylglycinamide formyltransferase n=1 Tax=Ketogulonicigenium robustum TaxID=92947 RepID=A0A1W6NYT1_9RHOB|nr:phosphoribosylglycinamide formyltransferase [Ketogulonicigenium robustum]ARO14331.1 phosphoribosylglycinamide formyltransferase [Ketogulonicigenium robustum]